MKTRLIDLESIALIFVLLTIGIGGVTFNLGYENIMVMLCIVVATSTKMNKLWGNNIIGTLGITYISYGVLYKISNYNEGTLINAEIVILCFTILMMFAYIIYDTIGMIFVKKGTRFEYGEFCMNNWMYGSRYNLEPIYYILYIIYYILYIIMLNDCKYSSRV